MFVDKVLFFFKTYTGDISSLGRRKVMNSKKNYESYRRRIRFFSISLNLIENIKQMIHAEIGTTCTGMRVVSGLFVEPSGGTRLCRSLTGLLTHGQELRTFCRVTRTGSSCVGVPSVRRHTGVGTDLIVRVSGLESLGLGVDRLNGTCNTRECREGGGFFIGSFVCRSFQHGDDGV